MESRNGEFSSFFISLSVSKITQNLRSYFLVQLLYVGLVPYCPQIFVVGLETLVCPSLHFVSGKLDCVETWKMFPRKVSVRFSYLENLSYSDFSSLNGESPGGGIGFC